MLSHHQSSRPWRTAVCALVLAGLGAFAPAAWTALSAGYLLDMRVLVIGPRDDPGTAVNEAIEVDTAKAVLDRVGIPYDVSSYDPAAYAAYVLEPAKYSLDSIMPALTLENDPQNPNHGRYQGIIFALSDYRMNPYYPATWVGQTADAAKLEAYAYKYGVRIASFYATPVQTGCLKLSGAGGISVGTTAANGLLTAAAKTALPYLKAGVSATFPFPLKQTYYYPSVALPASGTTPGVDMLPSQATVTPWITINSQPVASVCKFTESSPAAGTTPRTRELLALNFDNAPFLNHSIAVSYGIVDWVTKGIHLGQRHVYLDPQVDDLFLPDDEFPYTVLDDGRQVDFRNYTRYTLGLDKTLNQISCNSANAETGTPCEYRMTGKEFANVMAWQDRARSNDWAGAKTVTGVAINTANANGADGLRLNMVYNGMMATLAAADSPCGALCDPAWAGDTLTASVVDNSSEFKWINHTWDHTNLGDPVSGWPNMAYTATGTCPNTVLDAYTELCWNNKVKQVLGLAKYSKEALVTPAYSGLYNRDALDAMAVFGIKYMATDISRPTPPVSTAGCPPTNFGAAWSLPGPNTGKYNCTAFTKTAKRPTARLIYEVPRYPTALYYLVGTSQEWTDAFNFFYGVQGVLAAPNAAPFVSSSGARRNMNYTEIVNYVSDTLLSYMLSHDLRPWMFHAGNLRQYSGTRFLLGDLLEVTLTKYNSWYQNLPIRSPNLKAEGDLMKQRMVYNTMGVSGMLSSTGIVITADGTKQAALTNPSDGLTVVVPVTGVAVGSAPGTTSASNPESYGSGAAKKSISYVNLTSATGYRYEITGTPAW